MPYVWRSAFFRGLIFSLFLLAHLSVTIGFYPKFLEEMSALVRLASNLGSQFKLISDATTQSDWGYMAVQQFFKFGATTGTFVAVLFASGAVAGEAERRTLEVWLARPLPRWRVLLERYVAGALAIAVPFVVTSALGPVIAGLLDVPLEPVTDDVMLWAMSGLHSALFLLIIYGIAFLCSTRAQNVIRLILTLLLIGIALYAAYFVPGVNEWSPYEYVDPKAFENIRDNGGLLMNRVIPFSLINIALLIASLISFERRQPS